MSAAATKERIDILLVDRQLAVSREKARAMVIAGDVIVGDERIDKPGTKVAVDASIRLRRDPDAYVSRAAHKLLGALDGFGVSPAGRVALDVGASTGGFTQVLLERGATLVHALDVGKNQLAWKLRSDERVRSVEGLNFRTFEGELDPRPSIGTVDVSFIGLHHIFPNLYRLLADGSSAVVLVKPQFELGPESVGKGGIVRDAAQRALAVQKAILSATQCGFKVRNAMESPLPGTEGNIEHFIHLVKEA